MKNKEKQNCGLRVQDCSLFPEATIWPISCPCGAAVAVGGSAQQHALAQPGFHWQNDPLVLQPAWPSRPQFGRAKEDRGRTEMGLHQRGKKRTGARRQKESEADSLVDARWDQECIKVGRISVFSGFSVPILSLFLSNSSMNCYFERRWVALTNKALAGPCRNVPPCGPSALSTRTESYSHTQLHQTDIDPQDFGV